MGPEKKREVSELVRRSPVAKKHTLAELGLASSTYFRWPRRYREQGEVGLVDCRPQPGAVCNRLRPEEEQPILRAAPEEPDRSPREISCWLSDHSGFSVSETISNEKANLLNGRQKALQPSQAQPVQQLWQVDLRCGEMCQDVREIHTKISPVDDSRWSRRGVLTDPPDALALMPRSIYKVLK